MNLDDMNMLIEKESRQHFNSIRQIKLQYAKENTKFNVGDYVTDHIGTILVESIHYDLSEIPTAVYIGVKYTKNNKPFKSCEQRNVYQSNIRIRV